ncbi:MAG: biosynthetic arginine decarboxylase [Parachlamydiaceae bacterium]|nr:biosynthetic arginine decarboxylase [Parachlamydiaceae bacterium]
MVDGDVVKSQNNLGDQYRVRAWGSPYFDVNTKGNVSAKFQPNGKAGDVYELVQSLVQRGIEAPILIRFDGILRDRIRCIQGAFDAAINEFRYGNTYRLAYPIKVNQQRTVVDFIQTTGSPHLLGLEVGSKPELIAVLSINEAAGSLLLCNGYKDAEYIEIALLATKIGRRSIIIIEQFYELQLLLGIAEKLNIEAEIGFRMRPFNKGSGRWQSSGGDMAKFGLSAHEINLAIELLKKAGKIHWVKLLHFHLGSQIPSIVSVKKALSEAARMYTELAQECPSMCFFDTGGGLGVDYDGSRSSTDSSMDYTVEEYARDVVSAIGSACEKAEVSPPTIISESGRALVAHHSVLITEVIDVAPCLDAVENLPPPPSDQEVLTSLFTLYQNVNPDNCHEVLHDAQELKEHIFECFVHGSLNLKERAYAEQAYKYLISKVRHVSKELNEVPEEIKDLDKQLLDIYFCNFSVFQSLPDAWAIDQLFPIMPIHRLNEEPKRRGFIADLSCDSDGKIDKFVNKRGTSHYLKLHEYLGTPYYLGVFFVGAYQEILGALHNLFGDTNAVHVDLDEEGQWQIKHVIEGDTIREVLNYVQYDPHDLIENLRNSIEKSLKLGRLSPAESAKLQKKFKEALESYTYLVV